jgi:hypothetical protein
MVALQLRPVDSRASKIRLSWQVKVDQSARSWRCALALVPYQYALKERWQGREVPYLGGQGRDGLGPADRDAAPGEDQGQPDQRLRLLHRHAHQGRRARRETPVRLNLIAIWREATVFTEAERAALELAEQGTRLADAAGGVTDETWAKAAKHYDEDQLAGLVSLIAVINSWNRLNVITQQPAGDYQPGQWG